MSWKFEDETRARREEEVRTAGLSKRQRDDKARGTRGCRREGEVLTRALMKVRTAWRSCRMNSVSSSLSVNQGPPVSSTEGVRLKSM